jgi:rRNA maturation endonuclease Nob1
MEQKTDSVLPAAMGESGNVCAACGFPLAPDQVFCTNCGSKTEPKEDSASAAEDGVPVADSASAAEDGTPVADSASAVEDEALVMESQDEDSTPHPPRCGGCGEELAEGAAFCMRCGQKINAE